MERERLGQAKSKSKNIKHDIDFFELYAFIILTSNGWFACTLRSLRTSSQISDRVNTNFRHKIQYF